MDKKQSNNTAAAAASPEILLYEETRTLPEAMKLVLLGVARGMALSVDVPAGTVQAN